MLADGAAGEIYNIGAGNETPNRVLVDKLLGLFGVGEEMVSYVADRPGPRPAVLGQHRQGHRPGWRRQRTLDEALEQTVAWHRANEWWWRPLKERAGLVRVLITGAGGQLGRDLHLHCEARGDEVVAGTHATLDVGDRDGLPGDHRRAPDVVPHAGAWTAVDARPR